MVCTETIPGKIVEKIVDTVFQSVGRHVGFMLHYKQNLKNLDDVENNLQKLRSSVHEKVDEANHRGEAINNNVLYWLKDADETRQGVDNFRDEKAEMENMLCFNFISRYRLSKEAKDKVVHVKHVTEEGCKIENGTVSHPREAPPDPELEFPSSKDYEDFDSRDKVFKDIVKALKDPEVNRIGVYGTGGVGKTIMVRMVGKLVKEDETFDQVAIADVSQNVNVRKIQAQLANYLNLTLRTEVGRASQLWNRLDNGKKNLIILDDVWQELDLMEIGIPITYGNKSCKVVLTARNRDVWKNMDVDKDFKIQILIEKESWALFQKKVGNYVDADQELREIAWAVCKECQGLPVAINAIGAALKNKDMYAWRDALDKLQNNMLNDIEGIDRQVYASLKWSYDRLDSEDAKSCFLLCCLFPEDARIPIDDLVRYYMAGKNIRRDKRPYALEIAFHRVHLAVGMLQRSCLLLDDENYNEDVVKMVDVVRDVAISIAKGEKYSFLVKHGFKDWPEKATYEQCSVISLRPHDMREFPDELACPALHTLRLDCTDNESRLQVPDRFFDGTKNLMVLDLKNVTMSPILPASLAKLAKLQTLCLEGCKLGDIAILKDLKDHLEILSLRCSNIEVLPPEVGELTRLRLLDMAGCNELEVIPKGVISKLFRLEELYMPQTFRQWEGTRADGSGRDISCVSFDELMSLTRLTTLYVCIRDPALLPENFILENLHVRFDTADGGKGYYYYSKDSTGVLQLENIHLANPLEIYPILYPSKSFSHLTKLSMTDCGWKIFFSPSLAKGLVALKRLEIKRCMDMEGEEDHEDIIPINFSRLTHLLVTDCRLKYIFSSSLARRLVGLKELKIERCMDMEGVIGKEGEEDHKDIIPIIFSRLDYLRLNNLPNLKSFYPKKEKKATSSESCSAHDAQTVLFTDKVILPVLEVLEVDRLGNIVEIWDKQSPSVNENTVSCGKLMDVKVQHCEKLTNLVPSNILPQLQNLQKLCVEGCPKIESVVFKNEKEGAAVDDSTMIIPQLHYLRISDMENLKSFYSSSTASNAQSLFNHQVSLPNLEVLHLSDLENLERLGHGPLSAGSLSKLKEFSVRCCGKLLCVFPSQFLPMLRELQELTIESCHSLDVVFQLEGLVPSNILPNLQKLCVEGCPEIESMVFKYEKEEEADQKKKRKEEASDHSSLIIPRLRYLRISGVEKLKTFYSSSTASNAHSLFNRQVTFPRLQNLELEGCASLRNIFHPYMVKVLENLGELIVNDCSKMESVIDKEEEVQDGQQRKTDKTLFHFHRLSKLELRRLPELRTFCHFTRPLELPLLNEMVICDCPSMDSFSLGHVSTPNLSLKGVSLYPEKRLRW